MYVNKSFMSKSMYIKLNKNENKDQQDKGNVYRTYKGSLFTFIIAVKYQKKCKISHYMEVVKY
jgi:hypothetical protein